MEIKYIYICIISIMISISSLLANTKDIVDNGNLFKQVKADSIRLIELRDLGFSFAYKNPDTILTFLDEFKRLETRNSFLEMKGYSDAFAGSVYHLKGDYVNAISFYEKALVDTEKYGNRKLSTTLYNNIALILFKQQYVSKGLDYLHSALHTAIETKDTIRTAFLTFNIASNLRNIGQRKEAYKYLEQHELIMKQLPSKDAENKNLLGSSQRLRANLALDQNNYESAITYATKSITISEKAANPGNLSRGYLVLGYIKQAENKINDAKIAFQKSLELANNHNFEGTTIEASINLAKVLMLQKEYKKALNLAQPAFKKAQNIKDIASQVDALNVLANAREQLHQHKLALMENKKLLVLKDKLFELRQKQRKDNLAYKEKIKSLEVDNKILLAQNQAAMSELTTRRYVIASTLICIVIVALISISFCRKLKLNKTQNQLLKDSVRQKRLELENKNNELMASNKEIERFAYITSHDLKEPLRNICGFTSLIKRRAVHEFTPKAQQYFEFVILGVHQMRTLIDDVLSFSTVANQEIKIEAIDLTEIIQDASNLISDSIEKNGAKIIYNDLPTINSNALQIKLLFKNLIENGIKYNDSKQPIIEITHTIIRNNHLIKVKDNGIGIATKDQDRVFNAFERLHQKKSKKGTGLGLSISKEVIERLGGSINIESELGLGTIFHITLPVIELEEVKLNQKIQKQVAI